MKTVYNYTIYERYEKTVGIPYLNIKIKGRFLPYVFLIITLIVDVIIYLIISFLINEIVALIIVLLLTVFAFIALVFVAEVDKTTRQPNYKMMYIRYVKSYNEIFVNGVAYYIDKHEKNVDRIIFERQGRKFV